VGVAEEPEQQERPEDVEATRYRTDELDAEQGTRPDEDPPLDPHAAQQAW
jgi:hypothetical protein